MRGKLQGFDLCLEFFVHGMEFLRVIRRQCGKGVRRNWGLKGENGWFNGVDGSRQLGSCKAESLTDSSYDDDVCPSFSLGGLASWRNDENAHGSCDRFFLRLRGDSQKESQNRILQFVH